MQKKKKKNNNLGIRLIKAIEISYNTHVKVNFNCISNKLILLGKNNLMNMLVTAKGIQNICKYFIVKLFLYNIGEL